MTSCADALPPIYSSADRPLATGYLASLPCISPNCAIFRSFVLCHFRALLRVGAHLFGARSSAMRPGLPNAVWGVLRIMRSTVGGVFTLGMFAVLGRGFYRLGFEARSRTTQVLGVAALST